jgi:Ala-tRNA(Pro) deacylase
MTQNVFENICDLLSRSEIDYRVVRHEPTKTSEESAQARGESLEVGGKALLIKLGPEDFRLFVLSAAKQFDSKKVKKLLGVKSIRFANAQELSSLTGLAPGSVPPFGEPILPFPLYVDSSLTKNPKIAFNAGSLTDSIIMPMEDYLRIASPEVLEFSQD